MCDSIYILHEDLFRFGNSTSPRLTNIRTGEVLLKKVDETTIIVANGQGLSANNQFGMDQNAKLPADEMLTGWVWVISKGTDLPKGLKIIEDKRRKGHFFITPTQNMPLKNFVNLLLHLEKMCQKHQKIPKKKTG